MTRKSIIGQRELDRLIRKGEEQGYLTHEDIFAVLSPDLLEELDDLMGQLQRRNVPIAESAQQAARAREERRSRASDEPTARDTLSSYLREMSELSTLDRETEIGFAKEYRQGFDRAMRAVVDARLSVDQILLAGSRIRQGKRPVWDLLDRLRFTEEDPQIAREYLLGAVAELDLLARQEKRIRSRLNRKGVGTDRAQALSRRLKDVKDQLTGKLLDIPFDLRFLQQIASQMQGLHERLAHAESQRDALAEELGVPPTRLGRTLRAAGRGDGSVEGIPSETVREVDRKHRNLNRRIRRQERQAGMSYRKLHSVVLRYQKEMLRAQRARDKLMLSAQRLVLSSARYYGRRLAGSGMEVADLISAGNLGLIRAVELFDPERGNRFSTFAGHWVRHAMIRTIHTQSRTVYIPPHIRQQMSKILAVENELIQRNGRSPTDEEVARASDMEVPKLRHTMQSFGRMSSIDRPLDPDDSGSGTISDLLADERLSPHEELEDAERREMVRRLAERLQGRERTIVFMRMGWDHQEPMTLAEIGQRFGISRQRVEQLEKRALDKLRRWARSSGLGNPIRS